MKHSAYAVALALCWGTMPATAADAPRGPYAGILGAYSIPDSARRLDDGIGGQLLLGLPINRYLSTELTGFTTRADHDYDSGSDHLSGVGLDLNIRLGNGALSPFLLLGGGSHFDESPGEDESSGYANAGGGLLLNLGGPRNTALRLEGRRIAVFNDDLVPGRDRVYDTQVSLGAQFDLSEQVPPPPPPPAAPPPVLDSDGDGVPDDRDLCPGTLAGAAVDARGCALPPPDSDGDGVADTSDACPDTPRGLQVDARGCAIKAQVLVLRDVNFEFNKAVLTGDARTTLDGIAAGLRGQPTMEVRIEGHTDAIGTDVYNLRLSKARAEAVRTYLMQRGIATTRMSAEGLGESRPVADNDTDEGRAMNRRVEFKVEKQ